MLAAGVALLAVLIACFKFPKIDSQAADNSGDKGKITDLFSHRHLMLGAFTQFVFVGAQISIWSYFIDFAKDMSDAISEKEAARLLSYGFITLMIGRFSGAFIQTRWAPQNLLALYARLKPDALSPAREAILTILP